MQALSYLSTYFPSSWHLPELYLLQEPHLSPIKIHLQYIQYTYIVPESRQEVKFFRFIRIAMPSTVACAKDLTHFHASNPLPSFKFIYKAYRAPVQVHRYQSTVLQVKAGTEPGEIVSVAGINEVATKGCWIEVSIDLVGATTISTIGTC